MRSRQLYRALLGAIVACTGKAKTPAFPATDSAATDSAVGRAHVNLKARAMLPGFQAHLDSVARHPAMIRRDMPAHEAQVKHLVAAIHSDMSALGMPSDPAYEALADSVVRGSARLGTAGGATFNRLVAQHMDQLRRLAAVYQTKTAGMQ